MLQTGSMLSGSGTAIADGKFKLHPMKYSMKLPRVNSSNDPSAFWAKPSNVVRKVTSNRGNTSLAAAHEDLSTGHAQFLFLDLRPVVQGGLHFTEPINQQPGVRGRSSGIISVWSARLRLSAFRTDHQPILGVEHVGPPANEIDAACSRLAAWPQAARE